MRSTTSGSLAARSGDQERRGSQPSLEVGVLEARKLIRWRSRGERRGRRAGGGRGERKAVGRQARRGGRRSRGEGAGGRFMFGVVVPLLYVAFGRIPSICIASGTQWQTHK